MRVLTFFLAAVTLCACQTASYKATSQLAGTSWNADGPPSGRIYHIEEMKFGSKLAPSGMGQVELAPHRIVFFQVIQGKLVMRGNFFQGHNRNFDFDIDGDTLTLTALDDDGKPMGTQRFTRDLTAKPGAT
ncbi:MAG: hypothetical protein JO199_03075 [Candidatus Eremiobacteraeota bacterium]|nr:hypothetical protein [Candidatus Eremiobacteraeota bacterium]